LRKYLDLRIAFYEEHDESRSRNIFTATEPPTE
jgi:hypothetical protein